MYKQAILIVLVFLSGLVAAADQGAAYLCIAEKGAAVTEKSAGGFGAFSGDADNKYIVGKQTGLRAFGVDADWLSQCNYDESGRPVWCEMPGDSWGGVFMMDNDGSFVVMSLSGDPKGQKGANYYSVIGKCSRI